MKGLIVLGVLLLGSACSAASFALQIEDLTQNYSPIIDLFNAADDVLFYLFTNDGPSSGVEIPFKSFNASTLAGTTFNSSNPTRILIHGFLNGFLISTMYEIRDAYLKRGNFNIILIDWGSGAMTIDYVAARNRIDSVGVLCANVSNFLLGNGYTNYSSLVIVGHSLGGQTTGLCAKQITGGKLQNIVALDPAWPLFSMENTTARITQNDAENVEIIHSDGNVFGFSQPIGTKDVYPNYGLPFQPGTEYDPTTAMSHIRSCDFFAESLAENNTFIAEKCNSYVESNCTVNSTGYKMGGEPLDVGVTGIFYLRTNAISPYGRNGNNEPDSIF